MSDQSLKTREVLFQKMGNNWFIFSEVNNEMIYSMLPLGMNPHETKLEFYTIIENHLSKVSEQKKLAGKKTSRKQTRLASAA